MKEKFNLALFYSPILFVPSAALGYASILTQNTTLWAWAVGILTVATVILLGLIGIVIYLEHDKRKEEEANGKK